MTYQNLSKNQPIRLKLTVTTDKDNNNNSSSRLLSTALTMHPDLTMHLREEAEVTLEAEEMKGLSNNNKDSHINETIFRIGEIKETPTKNVKLEEQSTSILCLENLILLKN